MFSEDMSSEERNRDLPPGSSESSDSQRPGDRSRPLEDAAASAGRDVEGASQHSEDQLGQDLGDTADSVTRELRDLQDELMLPAQGGAPSVGEPAAHSPAETNQAGYNHAPADVPFSETVPPPAPVSAPAAPHADRAWQAGPGVPSGVTDDDRLLSMLSWLSMAVFSLPIVPFILLLSENTKNRSYQRYHAVTGLLFYAAAVVYELLAGTVFGILMTVPLVNLATCLCLWVIFFVPHAIALYYAFKAYGGKRIDLPYLTAFGRRQGWL
jgi:hypothetical protein